MRFATPVLAVAALFTAASVAGAAVSLTVYSTADPASFDPQKFIAQQRQGYNPQSAWEVPGFGVVRDERSVDLKKGPDTLRFTNVAAFIDPTTVSFADLSDPGATAVLEQQFIFDLVSPEKLLEKYVDQPISVRLSLGGGQVETVTGTLLATQGGGLVVQTPAGVRIVNSHDVQLGELPGGLITRPTLQWLLQSSAAGKRNIRTTYQTAGLTWRADYNLVLGGDEKTADLSAWVTLMNLSGASYPDASLKLIAGNVQRVQPPRPRMMYMARAAVPAAAENQAFEEKSFYEYHLYTLPRHTDVLQNTTQQIALFPPVSGVGVEKVLMYDGGAQMKNFTPGSPAEQRDLGVTSGKKVDVFIRVQNTKANHMGMPLPAGKVRVYKQDPADKNLEFLGEDLIDHTAKNEKLTIRTGQAFDVTGQRTQTGFTIDRPGRTITESFRITLANAKDAPQDVTVQEHLYRWSNWQITRASDKWTKLDARTIHFDVTVPAGGKKTVEYTVKYTW